MKQWTASTGMEYWNDHFKCRCVMTVKVCDSIVIALKTYTSPVLSVMLLMMCRTNRMKLKHGAVTLVPDD